MLKMLKLIKYWMFMSSEKEPHTSYRAAISFERTISLRIQSEVVP